MGHSRPLFLFFRLFKTIDSKQMFNKSFANDCIQTADLRCCRRPLYQLRPNHCPIAINLGSANLILILLHECLNQRMNLVGGMNEAREGKRLAVSVTRKNCQMSIKVAKK